MSFSGERPTNRGVRQDFPLRNYVNIRQVKVQSGDLYPSSSVIFNPKRKLDLLNKDITPAALDFVNGYFFSSLALTGAKNIFIPDAVYITQYLGETLKRNHSKDSLSGTSFDFIIDNIQGGAFDVSLVAGTGITLQGSSFDVVQGEIGIFSMTVHDNDEIIVSRSDNPIPFAGSAFFSISENIYEILTPAYLKIGYFPWIQADYGVFGPGKIVFYCDITDLALDIRITDPTLVTTYGVLTGVTTSGINSFPIINPVADGQLVIQVRHSGAGSTNPAISGISLLF